MSLDHTVLKVNYKLMFDSMHPLELEYLEEQDGIIRSKLTWQEAKAGTGLLERLGEYVKKVDKIVWFQPGDPYKGSKPFKINWIGLESPIKERDEVTIMLIVAGQQSERIKKKWIRKLSLFFGYPVSILWEEDIQ